MTDPEDPAAKNEQELNLFSDQPGAGDTPAAPEDDEYVLRPDDFPLETPGEPQMIDRGTSPEEPYPGERNNGFSREEPEPVSEEMEKKPEREPDPDDDSPVVAPPFPRKKQPAPVRPGIVVAPVRPPLRPTSVAPAAPERKHKPLPHALQAEQPLGQMLSSIRTARGMSLEEVASFTRIRKEYLVELEAGELLQKLPPVYISAYVRKLAEVYDLSPEDSEVLLKRMRKETPQDPEELPKTLLETVNENTLVNEGETKRIRNVTVLFYVAIGLVSIAVLWLVVLAVVHYARTPEPVPGPDPAAAVAVQPAEEPVSQTIHLDESELDVLIVPETPSISVLKMSKSPGVRESL